MTSSSSAARSLGLRHYTAVRLAPKGTQKNIDIQFLRPWPALVPSDEEQCEIVAILDVIDRRIDQHRRKHAVLEELFEVLLGVTQDEVVAGQQVIVRIGRG